MKKNRLLLTVLLTLFLIFVLAITAFAETRRLGDVDGNKTLTAADARLALRAAVDLEDLQGMDLAAANADQDAEGKITAADARLILRAAVDLEEITKILHNHEPGAVVRENEVAPGCLADGAYDAVVYCQDPECTEKELSRTKETVPALGHDPAAAVKENEVAPTCLEDGSYQDVVYCKRADCPAKELSREDKVVPALGHTPKLDTERSEYALTGESTMIYTCARCGKDGTNEPTLKKAWTFSGEINEENVAILNYFLNSAKDGSNKFSGFKTIDTTASTRDESFEMKDVMKWLMDAVGGDTSDMPRDLNSFKQMLRDSIVDLNGSKTLFYGLMGTPVEKDSFNILHNDLVSLLTPSDIASLSVEHVQDYDFTSSLKPTYGNAYPLIYYTNTKGEKVFWDASTSSSQSSYNDFNTQTSFINLLNASDDIVKITIKVKDESFDNSTLPNISNKAAISHIFSMNSDDFDFNELGNSLGMTTEDDVMVNSSAQTNVNSKGTVTYYFDAASAKPLAAVYSSDLKTSSKFSMSMTLTIDKMLTGLSSGQRTAFYIAFGWAYLIRNNPYTPLSMGATVDFTQRINEYYVFNPQDI